MSDLIKIAAVQMRPQLMKTAENLDNALHAIKEAAINQALLIIFNISRGSKAGKTSLLLSRFG